MSVLFCIILIECLAKPIGDRRLREGHSRRRGRRETDLPSVRHISVTVPAGLPRLLFDLHRADTTGMDKLLVELRVATHTVLINDRPALRYGLHRLRLSSHREDIRVTETILRFEKVLVEDRGVWYVAVVARSMDSVRTVAPGCIIRLHDMTIDADRGFVAEVTVCLRHIDEISHQPHTHTCTQHGCYLGAIGREDIIPETLPISLYLLHNRVL